MGSYGYTLLFIAVVGFAWEWFAPLQPYPRFKALSGDSLSLITIVLWWNLNEKFQDVISPHLWLPSVPQDSLLHSTPVKFFLVFIVLDFIYYWQHRWQHRTFLWITHRWHHTIRNVNLFSGLRSSLTDVIYFGVAPFLLVFLLPDTIGMVIFSVVLIQVLSHINIKVNIPILSKLLVTPQYHRIHHSMQGEHQQNNFGNLWSFWDRVFGTYIEPEKHTSLPECGLEQKETVSLLRMGIGI